MDVLAEASLGEPKFHAITGTKADTALVGRQRSLVVYLTCDQNNAAVIGGDAAFVDHLFRRIPLQIQEGTGIHEIIVVNVQGGSQEAAGIDDGSLADEHAVRVYEPYAAASGQFAQDFRRVIACHPIQNRLMCLLIEMNTVTLA